MTVDTAKYRKIFEHLRSEIRDPSLPPRRILVPAPLVVRESTKES